MRDSRLAFKFTQLKMTLSLLYLNAISFNVSTGGLSGSTSGNLMTTSTSFSTGTSSGLKRKRKNGKRKQSIDEANPPSDEVDHLQFLQHFNFGLDASGSIGIVSEAIDEFLHMLPMSQLRFVLAAL